jgi:hypothetical protein
MVGVAYLKHTSTLKKLSDLRLSKTAGSFPRTGTLPVSRCVVKILVTSLITKDIAKAVYPMKANFLSVSRFLLRAQYETPTHIMTINSVFFQYVRQPRSLKQCASIAVVFYASRILIPKLLYYMDKC